MQSSLVKQRFKILIYCSYRTPYFTDSGNIGPREFVSTNYQRFKHPEIRPEKVLPSSLSYSAWDKALSM